MNLRINNLSKKYGEKILLDNFSFSFDESGIYFITGDSGVGKTTLLRIIAGLDNDFSGTVKNGGFSNVSFMFQEYRLFPMLSATKNAALSQGKNGYPEALTMLKRLGFDDTDLNKKPSELSGGMKQRVAFARAILKKSPIVILDEPTKELDQDSVSAMLQIISEESLKRLILIVTHDNIAKKLSVKNVIHL